MVEASKHNNRLIIVFLLAACMFLYVLPAQISPTNFLQDDSYFYLQVASQILGGKGSTFHTITPTNGYHPLWMLFSIAGVFLAGSDKILSLNLVIALQFLIFAGTAYYFYRITQLISVKYWITGLAILAAYFLGTGIYASEAHLNGLTLIITLFYFLKGLSNDNVRDWILTGVFAGLSVLARLDNIFIIGILFGLGVLGDTEFFNNRIFKRSLVVSIPFIVVVAPYLIYNFVEYGHFVPISGSIKGIFPTINGDFSNLGRIGQITFLFALVSILAIFHPGLNKLQKILLGVMGTGVVLHGLYVILFTDHYTFWPWYYVSGVVNICFLLPILLEWFLAKMSLLISNRVINYGVVLFTVFIFVGGISRAWIKSYNPSFIGPIQIPKVNQYRWPDEVAVWMRDNLPPESGVFMNDWPGVIGYYSELRILPMDGLMNDFQYNEDILDLGIRKYLCMHQVSYYFGHDKENAAETVEVEVYAPLYRIPAGTLELLENNKIINIKEIVKKPEETPPLAIWRIDNLCP